MTRDPPPIVDCVRLMQTLTTTSPALSSKCKRISGSSKILAVNPEGSFSARGYSSAEAQEYEDQYENMQKPVSSCPHDTSIGIRDNLLQIICCPSCTAFVHVSAFTTASTMHSERLKMPRPGCSRLAVLRSKRLDFAFADRVLPRNVCMCDWLAARDWASHCGGSLSQDCL